MPATLSFDDYVDALHTATSRLCEATAGLPDERAVPTCPGWSARQLIAHLGMVHRWAAGIVRGELNSSNADAATRSFDAEGLGVEDPGAWLLSGADDLSRALREAADDLDRFFFLNDAPRAKLAWARRQCHETTIHAVDALSARLGRIPTAADAGIAAELAVDGIDELLRGFATRRRQTLGTPRPLAVVVDATDAERAWTLRLSDGPAGCDEGRTVSQPDATISGTAARLYLGLWNRGDEMAQDGIDAIGFWRDHMQIEWS